MAVVAVAAVAVVAAVAAAVVAAVAALAVVVAVGCRSQLSLALPIQPHLAHHQHQRAVLQRQLQVAQAVIESM